jgi:hypothetical protein
MSPALLLITALIYIYVAVDLATRGEWMALTFMGYAIANIGILLSLK